MTKGEMVAHIKTGETKAQATPPQWLGVGRDIGIIANRWALRDDLVAYVGPGAGGPAPACYSPASAEIEVNVEVAFGAGIEPEQIGDLTKTSAQFEYPKATGAILHEAFHARFSRWSMPKAFSELQRDEYEALNLLEESRIEYQGLLAMPDARPFLRACALEIVLADTEAGVPEMTPTIALTNLVGMCHARIDAGILDASEVKKLTDLLEDNLGLEVVSKLRSLAYQAQQHDNHTDLTAIYPLAKEWAKIVRELVKERGEDVPKPEGGCGFPIPKELLDAIKEALEEAVQDVAVNNFDELLDAEQAQEFADQAKAKANEAKERMENKDVAKKIFDKSSGPGASRTGSRLTEQRNPTTEEKVASVKIGNWLDKAKYRERDITELFSETPPGRLRSRAIVQREALRARGVMAKAEPFRRTVRKMTENPTLNVGVMVDISGSMGDAMQPMATTAWVMANAVNRIQGRCAMVYFGNDVFPTLKAGQKLEQVQVFSATDGTEKFENAFRALDGSLNLLHGTGARLLVIVSDGQYTSEETRFAKYAVEQCKKAGVAILWLPFDSGSCAREIGGDYAKVVTERGNPAKYAEVIGKACAEVLTKVGHRAVA